MYTRYRNGYERRAHPRPHAPLRAPRHRRFKRVQRFLSYARLVKSQKSSGGKVLGTSGAKIGNAHLKWAFSEAAVFFLRKNLRGQKHIDRLRSKHGKGKALSILAARLGRASYYMLRRSTDFDMDRFMN